MKEKYQNIIKKLSRDLAEEIEENEHLNDAYLLTLDDEVFQIGMSFANGLLDVLFKMRSEKVRIEYRKHGYHVCKNKDLTVHSLVGDVCVDSPSFCHPQTGEYQRPMRKRFGVYGNGKTLALQRVLSDFGSEFSYEKSSNIFERQFGQCFGRTSILSLTQSTGKDAEAFLKETFLEAQTKNQEGEQNNLFIELDGAMICTGRLMTARQAGLLGKGYKASDKVKCIEWKEVRTGLVQKAGEIKPFYACGHFSYDEICDQMRGLARLKGAGKNTKFIAVSDGGIGLREGLTRAFKPLVFVLDYAHLKKHFRETSQALGIEKPLQKGWVKSFTDELWKGEKSSNKDYYKAQVKGILERLGAILSENFNERLERLIGYVEKFSDAIWYGYFKQKGWPTGSGKIESAHRHVSQERLKIPGACWRLESINPMMALRIIKKNEWWTEFSERRPGKSHRFRSHYLCCLWLI